MDITVVKLGGTEGVDFSAICADAVELLKQGKKLVFVHGGSAEANALGEATWHSAEDDYFAFGIYVTIYRSQDAGNLFDGGERQGQFVVDGAIANAGSQCFWFVRT